MKRIKMILVFLLVSFITIGQTKIITNEYVIENIKGTYEGYISKDGQMFKVGDTLQIGKPSQELGFRYITVWNGISEVKMSSKSITNKAVIKKITIERKQLCIYTHKPLGDVNPFGLIIYRIEDAIALGELKSKYPTSDEALTTLKKEKDKLDLGIITPEQYEQKKTQLIKYIK